MSNGTNGSRIDGGELNDMPLIDGEFEGGETSAEAYLAVETDLPPVTLPGLSTMQWAALMSAMDTEIASLQSSTNEETAEVRQLWIIRLIDLRDKLKRTLKRSIDKFYTDDTP